MLLVAFFQILHPVYMDIFLQHSLSSRVWTAGLLPLRMCSREGLREARTVCKGTLTTLPAWQLTLANFVGCQL